MNNIIRLLLAFIFVTFATASFAQKVTIKAGTIVPLESVKEVKARNTHEGATIDFKVTRDVKVGDVIAIPEGSIAKGTVYEAKRSTAFGTRGRLGIKIRYVILPSGDVVNFASSDIYIKGQNRTALSVIIFCFTFLPFPCGSKAVMRQGYEYDATVASNTEVTVE